MHALGAIAFHACGATLLPGVQQDHDHSVN
jgi:hypothetical protein